MLKAVYSGFGFLALCVIAGLAAPQLRVWGMHFLGYYPPLSQVTFLFLAVVVLVMGFSPVRWRGLLPEIPASFAFSPLQWNIVVALACGVVFLTFSSATALLGDGQLWLNEIEAGTSNYLANRAPLTLFALHVLYNWLNPLLHIGAQPLFALTSIFAGMVAVVGWLTLAHHLRMDRITALLMVFTWGGLALFFGYVETYILMAATVTWMLVLMIISLREKKPSLWVPVLGVLAVGFSLAAVVFLPVVAFYEWRMISGKPLRLRSVLISSGALLLLAAIAYFALGWYKGTPVLLPLLPAEEAFGDGVLTGRHWLDVLNSLFLAAGAILALLIAWAVVEIRRGFQWDDEKLILLPALLFPLAAIIMHNPQLGMARDWDISAVLLIAAPIASLVIWDSIHPFVESPGRIRALLLAWILVMIVPWIGVQENETRSVSRFRDLLHLDPAKSESGWDYLSSYYFHRNRMDEWGQCNFEAMRYSNNPRYHANAAVYFAMRKDWPNARYQAGLAHTAVMADGKITEWEVSVTDPAALISLGNNYASHAYVHDAEQAFDAAACLQPESPWPLIASMDLFLRLRSFEEASRAIETLTAKGQNAIEQAQRYFQSKAEKSSSDQQVAGLLGLSLLEQAAGDSLQAAQTAGRASTLARDQKTAEFVSHIMPTQAQAIP